MWSVPHKGEKIGTSHATDQSEVQKNVSADIFYSVLVLTANPLIESDIVYQAMLSR